MRILHLTPLLGKPSETFTLERLNYSIDNYETKIITTRRVEEYDVTKRILNSTEVICGRYSADTITKIKFKVKDIIYNTYCSIDESALIDEIENFKPQIVHVHFGYMLASLLSCYKKMAQYRSNSIPVKTLVSLHGSDVLSFTSRFNRQGECCQRLYSDFNTQFICPTDFLKRKSHQKLGLPDDAISVVGNTISSQLFDSFKINFNEKKIEKSSRNLNYVNISRLTPWKGHQYLIEAFSKYVQEVDHGQKLIIIGDGEARDNLTKLISSLNMEDRVILKGALPHNVVVNTLASSDVYVHSAIVDSKTGQQESFGVAILEGLACGLPCITTVTGGIPDLLGEKDTESVIRVEEKSSDSLFNAFMSISENGISNDRSYVLSLLDNYSPDKINSNWKRLYSY